MAFAFLHDFGNSYTIHDFSKVTDNPTCKLQTEERRSGIKKNYFKKITSKRICLWRGNESKTLFQINKFFISVGSMEHSASKVWGVFFFFISIYWIELLFTNSSLELNKKWLRTFTRILECFWVKDYLDLFSVNVIWESDHSMPDIVLRTLRIYFIKLW